MKDYEKVPNRRRMITDGMMQWLIDRARQEGPDSPVRAMVNWIILGRYAGFRAAEWSQTTQKDYARIDWPGQPSRAFTSKDFCFLSDGKCLLDPRKLAGDIIRHLSIR